MVWKGCPRCSGSLYVEEIGRERDLACLQCGHRLSIERWLAMQRERTEVGLQPAA